jgi:hypothetical protein
MWPFNRQPGPSPRIQTLGGMVAYSLTNEATRSGWEREGEDLVNKALGVTVPQRVWRDGITVRGKIIPLPDDDDEAVSHAARAWREWDNECRRAEAMVSFVDAFEQIVAQAGEAGTAETVKQGSVHEHAVGNADAPKG